MSRTGTLPTAVCDLAMRLGVQREDDPPRVSLTQTGHMKRTLESDSWMAFKASQTIATHRCAFDWRAKVGPFGLISGPDTLSVSAGVGAMAAEVILGLDGDGRIATAFAPDRPRSATPPILPTPCMAGSPTIGWSIRSGYRWGPRSRGFSERRILSTGDAGWRVGTRTP
jgi:hypothetical protein